MSLVQSTLSMRVESSRRSAVQPPPPLPTSAPCLCARWEITLSGATSPSILNTPGGRVSRSEGEDRIDLVHRDLVVFMTWMSDA